MNTMQDFYTSISSVRRGHGSYLSALAEITRINLKQAMTLRSDLGWQDWAEQKRKTGTQTG